MILFRFIFRKKNKRAGCRGQLECVGRGALFFPPCFGNRADGWPFDYIRGRVRCLPAVGHVTTFTTGRGESSPPRFHFLSVLSFFTLRFWAARSTSAYFSPNRAATNSLQKMNAQTPFVQWAETPASQRHRTPEQGPGSSRAAGLCAFSRERRAPRSRSRESPR